MKLAGFKVIRCTETHTDMMTQDGSKVSLHLPEQVLEEGSVSEVRVYTRHVHFLGRVCAQGLLNDLPPPTLFLTHAQGLLNHCIMRLKIDVGYDVHDKM
jgi:hypothetical protein